METQTEIGLQRALQYIEKGSPDDAQSIIGRLMQNDLSSKELVFSSLCAALFKSAIDRSMRLETPYERGEHLLGEWKNSLSFISTEKFQYEPAVYYMQRGFFGLALSNYAQLLEDKDKDMRASAFWKAGVCFKKLGQFDSAQEYMFEANRIRENYAPLLADLADCFCLCGEDDSGKLIFREAFFLSPMEIDLDFLDSQMIRSLIEKTADKGYSGNLLRLWIPVYGVIWGILNKKRSLRSQEVAKLRQDIYELENQIKEPGSDKAIIKPRLINLYFWLMDYYVETENNSQKTDDVLLRIKIIDSDIHNLYSK